MDHARVCELLEAKDRIERTLLERGVELDSQGRDSIVLALRTLTEDGGYTVEGAVYRILDVHRRAMANAA